jgi:hypothetical protein
MQSISSSVLGMWTSAVNLESGEKTPSGLSLPLQSPHATTGRTMHRFTSSRPGTSETAISVTSQMGQGYGSLFPLASTIPSPPGSAATGVSNIGQRFLHQPVHGAATARFTSTRPRIPLPLRLSEASSAVGPRAVRAVPPSGLAPQSEYSTVPPPQSDEFPGALERDVGSSPQPHPDSRIFEDGPNGTHKSTAAPTSMSPCHRDQTLPACDTAGVLASSCVSSTESESIFGLSPQSIQGSKLQGTQPTKGQPEALLALYPPLSPQPVTGREGTVSPAKGTAELTAAESAQKRRAVHFESDKKKLKRKPTQPSKSAQPHQAQNGIPLGNSTAEAGEDGFAPKSLQLTSLGSMPLLRTSSSSGLFTPRSPSWVPSPGDSPRNLFSESTRRRRSETTRRMSERMLQNLSDPTHPFGRFTEVVEEIKQEFGFTDPKELMQLDKVVEELKHADLCRRYQQMHSLPMDNERPIRPKPTPGCAPSWQQSTRDKAKARAQFIRSFPLEPSADKPQHGRRQKTSATVGGVSGETDAPKPLLPSELVEAEMVPELVLQAPTSPVQSHSESNPGRPDSRSGSVSGRSASSSSAIHNLISPSSARSVFSDKMLLGSTQTLNASSSSRSSASPKVTLNLYVPTTKPILNPFHPHYLNMDAVERSEADQRLSAVVDNSVAHLRSIGLM